MTGNSVKAAGPGTHADPLSRELLQSVVDVARAIFGAQASSIFLLDDDTQELTFQAVSGQGQDALVGKALPASRGIAGWVAMSGEALVVDDLSRSPAFDREFAESTAYVPDSLMAAPLTHAGRVLGVLEVLDPAPQSRSDLNELDLLALFARQAAIAVRVVAGRNRQTSAPHYAGPALDDDERAIASKLMNTLRHLLDTPSDEE